METIQAPSGNKEIIMKKLFLLALFIGTAAQAQLFPPATGCPANKNSSLSLQQSCLASQFQLNSLNLKNTMIRQSMITFNLVFHNPLGLTPAQVFTGMIDPVSGSPFACKLHSAYVALSSFVNAQAANSMPAEPCTVACVSDGTVTVSCPAP